jgi:hypothetical protein
MFADKDVLYSGWLAKYLAAFFNMSRSSVTRFRSASSFAIRTESSGDGLTGFLPLNWLRQLYNDLV